jgi:hypothetical protein
VSLVSMLCAWLCYVLLRFCYVENSQALCWRTTTQHGSGGSLCSCCRFCGVLMSEGVEKLCSLYCDTVVMAFLHAYSAFHPRVLQLV